MRIHYSGYSAQCKSESKYVTHRPSDVTCVECVENHPDLSHRRPQIGKPEDEALREARMEAASLSRYGGR